MSTLGLAQFDATQRMKRLLLELQVILEKDRQEIEFHDHIKAVYNEDDYIEIATDIKNIKKWLKDPSMTENIGDGIYTTFDYENGIDLEIPLPGLRQRIVGRRLPWQTKNVSETNYLIDFSRSQTARDCIPLGDGEHIQISQYVNGLDFHVDVNYMKNGDVSYVMVYGNDVGFHGEIKEGKLIWNDPDNSPEEELRSFGLVYPEMKIRDVFGSINPTLDGSDTYLIGFPLRVNPYQLVADIFTRAQQGYGK